MLTFNYRGEPAKLYYILIISIAVLLSYVIGLWTQSNINHWTTYFNLDFVCPLWLGWILALILNAVAIPLNLASELLEWVFNK